MYILCFHFILLLFLLIKVGNAKLGKSDLYPRSPKTPAPQYQPKERKIRKGKQKKTKIEGASKARKINHFPCS